MAFLHARPEALALLRAAWVRARDGEPCGWLVGRRHEDGSIEVERALLAHNHHPDPLAAFRLAPGDQLAVGREVRRLGWRVVGTWHGHLLGPPVLGRADRDALAPPAPGCLWIVGRERSPTPVVRAWLAHAGRVGEAPIRPL